MSVIAGGRNILSQFRRQKEGMIGLIIVVILTILSFASPLIVPGNSMATRHAELSAPAWMSVFDPDYFPDMTLVNATFKSAQDMNKFFIDTTQSGSNFYTHYEWVSEGAPNSPGALNLTIMDDPNKQLDYAKPEGKIRVSYFFTWTKNKPPLKFTAHMAFKLVNRGNFTLYKTTAYEVSIAAYITYRGMSGEELRFELGRKGIIVPPQKYDPEEGIYIIEPPTIDVGKWLDITSLLESLYKNTMFTKGANLEVRFTITFRVKDPNHRVAGGISVLLDKIWLKAESHYYGVFGTDNYGRDIFAMVLDGLKISLFVGIVATVLSIFIGGLVGLISGYFGGKVDEVLMRIVDFLMVMPGLPLLITLAFVFTQMGVRPLYALIIVLTVFGWAGMARVIRSQVLSLKSAIYVEAAKAAGASSTWIIRKHILPGVWPLVMMYLMTGVVGNILAEASLSFLGVLTPDWPSIGRILQEASVQSAGGGGGGVGGGGGGAFIAWWWVLFPGLTLTLIGLAFYLIGDALVKIFNPKMRGY